MSTTTELEALGYVQRRADPRDRRSKRIGLTGRGRDEQQLADRILAEIEARHAARIGADRYAELRKLLRALALPDEDAQRVLAAGGELDGGDLFLLRQRGREEPQPQAAMTLGFSSP